ncbi:MAG: hypothetical protein GX900_08440 [Clostridiaceae bacterium]|nr:hypothetical protein [Clostridiaceae bacterium]
MSGLDKVKAALTARSEREAEALLDAAREASADLDRRENERIEAEERGLRERLETQRRQLLTRERANLALEERKSLLARRQEWIGKVFAAAAAELAQRDPATKLAAYKRLLDREELAAEFAAQPDTPVGLTLAAVDHALYEPLLKYLRSKGRTKVEAVDEGSPFTGGLKIIIGAIRFDYSNEEWLARRAGQLTPEIDGILRGEEQG